MFKILGVSFITDTNMGVREFLLRPYAVRSTYSYGLNRSSHGWRNQYLFSKRKRLNTYDVTPLKPFAISISMKTTRGQNMSFKIRNYARYQLLIRRTHLMFVLRTSRTHD